ncbi:erythromycin esterase family protein [Oscillospiraceae bacterium N12]|jgi:erythromycin esterase|uniref:Erythromycin esterase family protein n=1 Tax=Jilunia laotingensis TaxID=2763675 RepID=A0A926IJ41_9BACT|nr:erythromycin esterase family protein [Jilunia laotingensis]MBC8592437.1 erythromycin esterase family protein [Jilunia laotingensis]
MHYARVYILLFFYICIIIVGIWSFSPVNQDVDKLEIERYVHDLSSDTAEYSRLLLRLSDHRVVLLGEQTHSDGKTISYKERLIRTLHERFGYNVVLYEAGMYDMWLMNQEESLEPLHGLYYFWCSNHESNSLWEFYKKSRKSDNPIELGGFDVQYTGDISDSLRLKRVKEYLHTKDVDIQKYPDFVQSQSHIKYLFINPNILDTLQFTRLLSDIGQMALVVKERMVPDNRTDELYYRYLQGLKSYLEACRQYEPGEAYRMQLRDSLMADNFNWLANTVYKDRKIIVWCSNLHALYEDGKLVEFKPFGNYLKDYLGDEVISVVFSSYGRIDPDGRTFRTLSRKSLEYQIHSCGISEGYLDFSELDTASWLNRRFVSGINQGLSVGNDWSEMTDILIYIDKMTKPTY